MISMDSTLFNSYCGHLKNRIFKILPLYEEENEYTFQYVQSLIFELGGLLQCVDSLHRNSHFLMLMAILESLSDEILIADDNQNIVKREVFKCVKLVDKLKGVD